MHLGAGADELCDWGAGDFHDGWGGGRVDDLDAAEAPDCFHELGFCGCNSGTDCEVLF